MPIRSEGGLSCPPSLDWALLAAGQLAGDRARVLLSHVAECEHCGLTLRLATEALAESESDAVAVVLPPAHSKDLAARFAGSPKVVALPTRRLWPVVATIAAALALVVGGLTFRPAASGPSTETLLAQAYSERRPFDFRVGDAAFAPVRVVRSSAAARPRPLLDAEVRITQALAASPGDVAALQMRARAEMLESEPGAAIATLRRALERDPRNASLLADLGSAYAQDGQWNAAHDALTAALTRKPDFVPALFNRALVNQKRDARREAAADWDRYLRLDATSGWAKEARSHREALELPASN